MQIKWSQPVRFSSEGTGQTAAMTLRALDPTGCQQSMKDKGRRTMCNVIQEATTPSKRLFKGPSTTDTRASSIHLHHSLGPLVTKPQTLHLNHLNPKRVLRARRFHSCRGVYTARSERQRRFSLCHAATPGACHETCDDFAVGSEQELVVIRMPSKASEVPTGIQSTPPQKAFSPNF